MEELNQFISPDLQKVLAFLLPALAAISILVMQLSRGFSVGGMVAIAIFTAIAIYFLPGFVSLF